ncbi:MAG: hypothetical protein IJ719_14815 [Clostridia bacterium]|nr:hypothetical protein [Clostridia bacterium]
MHINFSLKMIPGIIIILAGCIFVFGPFLKERLDSLKRKLIGVGIVAVGAILVFLLSGIK